jgi:hypothetical protein
VGYLLGGWIQNDVCGSATPAIGAVHFSIYRDIHGGYVFLAGPSLLCERAPSFDYLELCFWKVAE